ncbi:MAG: TetR/AcrR family transcriptional regulator [Pseudomonadota bacterium]|nr:TetR/AcrR family transcriptional regulator [Pseudomonadota bacterium]
MRKQPRQQRSRDMVATLLAAAEQVIVERGLDGTSTNHIAEAAGVSVGSLYQYFDDKDAVIEALLEQFAQRMLNAVDARLPSLLDSDPRTATRGILEAVLDVAEQNACQRELSRHLDQLRTRKAFRRLEQHMSEACRLYVLHHPLEVRTDNLPATLFVTITAMNHTISRWLGMSRPPVSRADLIAALSDMVAAIIQPQSAVSRVRSRARNTRTPV